MCVYASLFVRVRETCSLAYTNSASDMCDLTAAGCMFGGLVSASVLGLLTSQPYFLDAL